MKKLIYKVLTLGFLVIALLILSAYVEGNIIRDKISFRSKSPAKYAIFGHSHPETAFNDSIISNSENFSRSADSYYYIYARLKRIIEENKSIEVVFIEFTNSLVSAKMDNWIWGQRHLSTRYKIYEPFIDLEDQSVILVNNFSEYTRLFFESRKKNYKRILDKDYNMSSINKFGGYLYLIRDKTDSLLKSSNYKREPLKNAEKISETNLIYLRKILSFLEEKKIRTYLIRTPQHELEATLNNEAIFIDILNERFSDIPFLDLNTFPLENNEFGDLDHLNFKGARKFSLWFDSLLKDGLLDAENEKEFISKRMLSFSEEEEILLEKNFENKLKNLEQNLLQEIIKHGNKRDVEFIFTPGIANKNLFAYHKDGINYILIEMATPLNRELIAGKKVGLTGVMLANDANVRPKWLKDKNSFKLTWVSDIRIEDIEGKPYILISFQKNVEIQKLEVLTLHFQNDLEYAGKFGKTLRIKDFDL